MVIVVFFFLHWFLSLFTQSFFNHRYAAHEQFTMSRGWERFFFVLAYIFQGSSYLSPKAYGIMHRKHHAHTDTEKDPHSPMFSKNLFHMMWLTKTRYAEYFGDKIKNLEERYLRNLPDWPGMDRLGESWYSRLLWGILYITIYVLCISVFKLPYTHWLMYFLLPIHFLMGPFHGAIVNWFAHKFGYENFKQSNTSKNLWFFNFMMWGEGYHNNHHKFPDRANFAVKWFEFDWLWPLIYVMNKLHIIRLKALPIK